MFTKSRKQTPNQSQKQIPLFQECLIIQKINRIDGHQTIKKYKKCQLLGKGGFANCFVSENVQTKKRAATKIIQKQLLTSQKTKLRLLNQIRLHKTLHHQNIVQFQHYFQDKNNVYIFLQLCQNQSLNEIIKIRQYFSTSQIQFFMLGIINGLQYLHSKSIIHRDLKLGNIFLDNKFNIKLGDFGLATKLEFKKECKRTICGTPNYIAPEILEGKGYHFQVDIWSVGVILYTLYYTIPPFETEEAATTYQKIKKIQYSFPKYLMVPQQAIDLIKRILVKNPADRPTLEEILNSDFMKLGNKIYKELPSISAKRMPMKKDFVGLPFCTHDQAVKQFSKILIQQKQSQKVKIAKNHNQNKENIVFVKQFQSLSDSKYFYELSNGISAIFTQDQIVFKDEFGIIKVINLKTNECCAKIDKDHPLKYLLNCKTKLKSVKGEKQKAIIKQQQRQTIMQTTLIEIAKTPVHIKKVAQQKKNNFYMIRLSNQSIQLIFADGVDYLITKNSCEINQIKNGQINIKNTVLKKDLNEPQKLIGKIDQNKVKYVKGIIDKIECMKEKLVERKQNRKQNSKEGHHLSESKKRPINQGNLLSKHKSDKCFNLIPKTQPFKLVRNS